MHNHSTPSVETQKIILPFVIFSQTMIQMNTDLSRGDVARRAGLWVTSVFFGGKSAEK
jgi:hypothetical protein